MTVIKCRTCGKAITRYSGHIGKDERFTRIRHHYKKVHPERFKKIVKKSVETKKEHYYPYHASENETIKTIITPKGYEIKDVDQLRMGVVIIYKKVE